MTVAPQFGVALLLLLGVDAARADALPADAAQPPHSIEAQCDSPRSGTQAETLSCYTPAAARLRSEVQRAFQRNLRTATFPDNGSNGFARRRRIAASSLVERLKGSQAAWIKYVDAQCSYEGQSSLGGSGQDILRAKCLYRANRTRLFELDTARQLFAR